MIQKKISQFSNFFQKSLDKFPHTYLSYYMQFNQQAKNARIKAERDAYHEQFCTLVAVDNYIPREAVGKLRPYFTIEECLGESIRLMDKPSIKKEIKRLRAQVNAESVKALGESIAHTKERTMRSISLVVDKATSEIQKRALVIPEEMMEDIVTYMRTLLVEVGDGEVVRKYSDRDIDNLVGKLTDNFSAKGAEYLLKATDQANKMFGLYEYNVTVDDKRDKLARTLDSISPVELLKLADYNAG